MVDSRGPLRAAVIGGGMGGQLSANALRQSPLFEPVAMADLRPAVCAELEAKYPGIRTFDSHRALFENCPVDVVCVSTFPPSHEEVTIDALNTLPLKGILVEKPLGHTAASGRRLLEAIKARRLPMVVPHNLLALATPLIILDRVRAGDLGELKLVEIQNAKWDIINAGIHWLNYFVTLTDNAPIDHVLAQADKTTRTYRDGMQVETIAVTSAQTTSGIRVVMHTGDDTVVNVPGKDIVFRLIGTRGLIEFYGWDSGYRFNTEWIVPPGFPVSGHRRHLENLAAMIENGTADYALPDSSLLALEIVEAAYLSARHCCRVHFPLESFVPPPDNDWNPGEPYGGVGGGRDGRKL
ncbi:MAG: Gfo/Idh/MocA family oxidoreductase [Capsulimonadales bacterium]|nr:Gfo/Idh/MocA family oxidoreductase [Capsulimonadales bacterium]